MYLTSAGRLLICAYSVIQSETYPQNTQLQIYFLKYCSIMCYDTHVIDGKICKHKIIVHIKITVHMCKLLQIYITNSQILQVVIYQCRWLLCASVWCKCNIPPTTNTSKSNTVNAIIYI